MNISAKVIAHSVGDYANQEIATLSVTLPRLVLAEFNTHRVLSRNSASSRAITIDKFIANVIEKPFLPVYWGKNQSGMQASVELSPDEIVVAQNIWLDARDKMIESVRKLQELGVHKQISNRLLEPWFYTTILVTATTWSNFFKLRCHKDAQPEIRKAAECMRDALNQSVPKKLKVGEWHIPFGDKFVDGLSIEEKLKVATARAARVSYLNFEGKIEYQKDFELHDSLKNSGHWSPFEHCAKLAPGPFTQSGNFRGWIQYRKEFTGESGE